MGLEHPYSDSRAAKQRNTGQETALKTRTRSRLAPLIIGIVGGFMLVSAGVMCVIVATFGGDQTPTAPLIRLPIEEFAKSPSVSLVVPFHRPTSPLAQATLGMPDCIIAVVSKKPDLVHGFSGLGLRA